MRFRTDYRLGNYREPADQRAGDCSVTLGYRAHVRIRPKCGVRGSISQISQGGLDATRSEQYVGGKKRVYNAAGFWIKTKISV
jgi:hypothetical protein